MSDGLGLDKSQRLALKRALVEAEASVEIEPAFPFRVEPFDILFFQIEANPTPLTPPSRDAANSFL